jgi:hypothetical protein
VTASPEARALLAAATQAAMAAVDAAAGPARGDAATLAAGTPRAVSPVPLLQQPDDALARDALPEGYLPPLEQAEVSNALFMAPPVVRPTDGKEVRWTRILLDAERCFEPQASADPKVQHKLLLNLFFAFHNSVERDMCLECSVLERGGFFGRLTDAMLTGKLALPQAVFVACDLLRGAVSNLGTLMISGSSDLVGGARPHAAPHTYQAAVDSFWRRSRCT